MALVREFPDETLIGATVDHFRLTRVRVTLTDVTEGILTAGMIGTGHVLAIEDWALVDGDPDSRPMFRQNAEQSDGYTLDGAVEGDIEVCRGSSGDVYDLWVLHL